MIGTNPYVTGGYQVLKVETHLHTLHSDGQHSVQAMFEACHGAGYDAISLTDHNTQSGVPEALEVAEHLGVICLPGVEVTTFRGHAVVLGVAHVPEWRDLETRGIDALAQEVHASGGLICIAHPAALGSPVCSGCTWEWPVQPISVDLWEVFSAPRPNVEASLALWRGLLASGGRAAPIASGDVHSVAAASKPKTATYVYARERSRQGVIEALRAGRLFASRGARLDFWVEKDDGTIGLAGSELGPGTWQTHVSGSADLQGRVDPSGSVNIQEVELGDGRRCLYAERRSADHRLEAVSAAIWIATSH